MNKNILVSLIMLMIIFTACSNRDDKISQQEVEKSPTQEKEDTGSNSDINNFFAGCVEKDCEVQEQKIITIQEVQDTYIKEFGTLINSDDWDKPTDIKGNLLINYYREYLFENNKLNEQYYKEGREGFLFPEDEFESFIKKHFRISSQYMQSNYEQYESGEGYLFEGGGIGIKYRARVFEIEKIDNKLKIYMDIVYDDRGKEVVERQKELTIELRPNGEFFYTSYITI